MLLKTKVQSQLDVALIKASTEQASHLQHVRDLLEGKNMVTAAVKSLNRYSLQAGKIFGTSSKSPTKFKVLRVIADDIVLQDLSTQRIKTYQVDALLKEWSEKGFKEISLLEDIISTVKNILGPALGVFLTAALVSWLMEKIGK